MLTSVRIQNYKSIEDLTLPLGRINVLIGENGAGKSNILEAVTLAAAACAGKLDDEFLAVRGVRVTSPALMRSAFASATQQQPVKVDVVDDRDQSFSHVFSHDGGTYSGWTCAFYSSEEERVTRLNEIRSYLNKDKVIEDIKRGLLNNAAVNIDDFFSKSFLSDIEKQLNLFSITNTPIAPYLSGFISYAPENSALRAFDVMGQIKPLGSRGEGLFQLLHVLSVSSKQDDQAAFAAIRAGLQKFGWFQDLNVVSSGPGRGNGLEIRDRFLAEDTSFLDQRSVNEGFLFVLFYLALFSAPYTPAFFGIDNVDTALNPKMCRALLPELTQLASRCGKQVIMTTHNPAILDGLNLNDDMQRLFAVSRNSDGKTKLRRITQKPQAPGAPALRLSEAFMDGALGGLPKGF